MSVIEQMLRDFFFAYPFLHVAVAVLLYAFKYGSVWRCVVWPFYIGLDLFDWAEEAWEKYKEEDTLRTNRPTS
jgi:hypothetical protein